MQNLTFQATLAAGAAALAIAGATLPAEAAAIFTGSSGSRSASATFDIVGGNLQITLQNTGSEAQVPTDVLTAIFFTTTPSTTFGLTSATLGSGSNLFQNQVVKTNPGNITAPSFTGGWQYKSGTTVSSKLSGFNQGIGTAGFNIFDGSVVNSSGQGGNFDYGLISGYGNSPNTPVLNSKLIDNSIVFLLSAPQNFSLDQISNVSFQYGTSLTEPRIPGTSIPTPALLPGLIGMGLAALRKRKGETTEAVSEQ